jgi:TonB family protein
MRGMLFLLASIPLATCPFAAFVVAQQPATAPANESRTPVTLRSPHSIGPDLAVPLCPEHFHDSLAGDGIAVPMKKGVTPASIKTTVPALITQQAIDAGGTAHIGNFNVVIGVTVDTKGLPHDVCIAKSSGYGLDASAAKAVEKYLFVPAKKNGRPVKSRVPVEVRFVTQNPPSMGTPRSGEPAK